MNWNSLNKEVLLRGFKTTPGMIITEKRFKIQNWGEMLFGYYGYWEICFQKIFINDLDMK